MAHTSSPSSKLVNGERTGRDERGCFVKGNPGGPGNPFAQQIAVLRAGLLASVTAQDIQDVLAALLVQAKKGNVAAARLFLAYSIGKPADRRNAGRSDSDEGPLPQQPARPAAHVEET